MPLIRMLAAVLVAQATVYGHVDRIVDGDTIKVRIGTRVETVRYIGVDTPETVHPTRGVEPYGKAASKYNASLVEGEQVRLEFDAERRDRYGRLLAYVYVDTLFVNAELLRQGYAQLMTIPPNVGHVDEFVRLQQEAREVGRGLWGLVSTRVDTHRVAVSTQGKAGSHSITVFVTRTGKKYHTAGCRYLHGSGIGIPLGAACSSYSACLVCKPPYERNFHQGAESLAFVGGAGYNLPVPRNGFPERCLWTSTSPSQIWTGSSSWLPARSSMNSTSGHPGRGAGSSVSCSPGSRSFSSSTHRCVR